MTVIQFRSPVTVELRLPGPPAPVGIFQVTQQFDTPDFYASQRVPPPDPLPTHMATDIGDRQCGAPIVAMASGRAFTVQDNASQVPPPAGQPPYTNALGVVIDHGSGIATAYWHLASWSVPNNVDVVAGQEIGKLGNTGLLRICHTHIEAFQDGVKFDPEPLMFGGSVDTGGDDVKLPEGAGAYAVGIIGAGVGIRTTAVVADDNLIRRTDAETRIALMFPLEGQGPYTDPSGVARRDWTAIKNGDEIACVATGFIRDIALTDPGKALFPPPVSVTDPQLIAEAKRATADKANAQMDAWTATRPRILP